MAGVEIAAAQDPGRPAVPTARRRRPGQTHTDRELLERFKRDGDLEARDELVKRMLPLVQSVVQRYGRGDSREDLLQVGTIGLLLAIDRFDPDRGVELSSYAVPTIVGEVRRFFRDRTWAVRPPRDLQDRSLKVRAAVAELTARHGRSPTAGAVAEVLGLSEEEVVEALVAADARSASSLDAPASAASDEDRSLGDALHCRDAAGAFRRAEARATIAQMETALTERERRVVRLRFEEDLTQAEIGELVGFSQMQVSRILRSALQKMRESGPPAHGAARLG
jgi:RNA polymerase sigma-B factor